MDGSGCSWSRVASIVRVTVPAADTGKASFLPFLAEAQEVRGQREASKLVFTLADVQKGAVVWFEGRD